MVQWSYTLTILMVATLFNLSSHTFRILKTQRQMLKEKCYMSQLGVRVCRPTCILCVTPYLKKTSNLELALQALRQGYGFSTAWNAARCHSKYHGHDTPLYVDIPRWNLVKKVIQFQAGFVDLAFINFKMLVLAWYSSLSVKLQMGFCY